MCLITDQKKPKIAEEDITVYKILTMYEDIYSAIFEDFVYNLRVLYTTTIKKDDMCCMDGKDEQSLKREFGNNWRNNPKLVSYGQGFHSAYEVERLQQLCIEIDGVIMECTIPKGSHYYDNVSGLVVSNQLIVIKEVLF